MANFLSPYKQELMFKLIESPIIVEQLKFNDSSITNPEDLVLTHIFPYEYVSDSTTEQYSFIMVEIEEFADSNNDKISYLQIHFFIATNTGIIIDDKGGGVRPDIMSDELKNILDEQTTFSTFKVKFLQNRPLKFSNDFWGRHVIYTVQGLDGKCK